MIQIRNTSFIQDAKKGRRVTPGWLAYILTFIVFIIAAQTALMAVFHSFLPMSVGSVGAQIFTSLSFLAPLLLLFAWVAFFEKRKIKTLGFRGPKRGILTMIAGLFIGIVLFAAPMLFLWLTGAYELAGQPEGSISGLAALPLLLLLVAFVALQASTEETIMRGFLLQNSGLKLPGWAAICLPAVVFILIHGAFTQLMPTVMILLFAVMASFLVLRMGSLWLVMGIHTGWSFAQGNIFGAPVNGPVPNVASLFYLRPVDGVPQWFTGGESGPEASLPSILVLIVATIAAYMIFKDYSVRTKSKAGVDTDIDTEAAKGL